MSKKEAANLDRQRKRQEAASAISAVAIEAHDPLAENYGEIALKDLQSKEVSRKKWTELKDLTDLLKDQVVLIRGRAQTIRAVGKKMVFIVVRESGFSVQCVLNVIPGAVSPQMVKFATGLSRESIVDIEGVVSVPAQSITGATQQVEIQVKKLYCVNKAVPTLPINIEDAARSEIDVEKALQEPRKKKSRKTAESDTDLVFDIDVNNFGSDDIYQNGDHNDDKDVGDEDEYDEEDYELGDDDDKWNDDEDVHIGDEIEELEKEYGELKNEEQDLLRNLKQHKDDDLQKSQAVKNQRALWDKTLEFRFLLQKAFSSSNRLPQEPVRSFFCDAGTGVSEAYSDFVDSSKKTLDSILELQQALLKNNPSIAHLVEANSMTDSNQLEASCYSNGDIDEEWLQISQMQSRIASFRNKSIDKWQRKTQVTNGATAIRDKLHAFNQSISQQVATYMRDPSKMTNSMQQNRSAVVVFGNVPNSTDDNDQKETDVDGDTELLDDFELYQQLLKEFFETIDPSSAEAAFYAMKRLQKKKRKIVDRRASKSRKIRYHVHDKIVNFMAPQRMDLPPMAPKLFENLFDLKSMKPASVA